MSCIRVRFSLLAIFLVVIVAASGELVYHEDGHNDSSVTETAAYKSPVTKFLYGEGAAMSVVHILELEKTQWHWYPWKRIDYFVNEFGDEEEKVCDVPNAIDDLPEDIFTRKIGVLAWPPTEFC